MGRSKTPPADPHEPLRFAAETLYTLQPTAVSLDEMAQMPQFAALGIQTLRRWAEDGRWQERRQAQLDKLRALLQRKMHSRLVQGRLRQLEAFEEMFDQGRAMLADERLVPKGGWEAVCGQVLRVGRAMDEYHVSVMQELAPPQEVVPEGVPKQILPDLDEDEARAAARAIVEVRRRRALALPTAEVNNAG